MILYYLNILVRCALSYELSMHPVCVARPELTSLSVVGAKITSYTGQGEYLQLMDEGRGMDGL